VPGLSETIRVRSLVGRYLEHSRIYYFGEGANGGPSAHRVYEAVNGAASAGLMGGDNGSAIAHGTGSGLNGPGLTEDFGTRRAAARDSSGRFVARPRTDSGKPNIANAANIDRPGRAGHPVLLPPGGRYLMGSADMMERNLDRRVETLLDVTSPEIQERLREILEVELADDEMAWELSADDTWHKVPDVKHFNAQRHFQELALARSRRWGKAERLSSVE
jgi:hypothetical protein